MDVSSDNDSGDNSGSEYDPSEEGDGRSSPSERTRRTRPDECIDFEVYECAVLGCFFTLLCVRSSHNFILIVNFLGHLYHIFILLFHFPSYIQNTRFTNESEGTRRTVRRSQGIDLGGSLLS